MLAVPPSSEAPWGRTTHRAQHGGELGDGHAGTVQIHFEHGRFANVQELERRAGCAAGQSLWDELQVTVPAAGDPYGMAQRIREVVEKETEADAQLAEQDWERITRQYGTQSFSAKPSVDLRPAANGLEIQVRYITRGPQRYEVKSRLFRQIVEVLYEGKTPGQV